MDLKDIIRNRRTTRIFSDKEVSGDILRELIDLGRLAPSGANLQPVSFIAINNKEYCDKIFPNTRWAAQTAPLGVPDLKTAPRAYILVLVKKDVSYGESDCAYASENIVLGAEEMGLGSCILASINKKKLREIFNVDENTEIHTLIALGYKGQQSFYEDNDETTKYYIDEKGDFHIPKKTVDNICEFYLEK